MSAKQRNKDQSGGLEIAAMIETNPAAKTQAKVLLTLGVMAYRPFDSHQNDAEVGYSFTARSTFDRLVDKAKARGFRERRQLIGQMRHGKATAGAIARCEAVCGLLTPEEIAVEFETAARWEQVMAPVRQAQTTTKTDWLAAAIRSLCDGAPT